MEEPAAEEPAADNTNTTPRLVPEGIGGYEVSGRVETSDHDQRK